MNNSNNDKQHHNDHMNGNMNDNHHNDIMNHNHNNNIMIIINQK